MTSATSAHVDEETPLLRPCKDEKVHETPVPWRQFSIVLFLLLAEPLTSQTVFPFTPQLINETGITDGDDKKVGYYVGLLASLFFATEALTVLQWSRISDRIGRKPVILIGLFGLALSMYSFGLSRTFTMLVISRCLNGALNGNVGVIRSMIGELTDPTNIARTLSYQPLAWSLGTTVGPLIGGALAHPVERFPNVFGGSKFLEKYPYFLPCAIPATFTLVAWLVTLLFLKETNQTGFTFASLFSRFGRLSSAGKLADKDSAPPPPFKSVLTRPVIISITIYSLFALIDIAYRALQPVFFASPRELGGLNLSPSAIGTALAIFGIVHGMFQVCFFAKVVKRCGNRTCFLFGIGSAIPIFALFPIMTGFVHAEDDTWGTITSDVTGLSWILILLVVLQFLLTIPLNLCYSSAFIYITAAAEAIPTSHEYKKPARLNSSSSRTTLIPASPPAKVKSAVDGGLEPAPKKTGKKTLGAVNGIAQCVVSIMRCISPYAASALYAQGLEWKYGSEPINTDPEGPYFYGEVFVMMPSKQAVWKHFGGALVYGILISLVCVTLIVGSKLPPEPWAPAEDDEPSNETGENNAGSSQH